MEHLSRFLNKKAGVEQMIIYQKMDWGF